MNDAGAIQPGGLEEPSLPHGHRVYPPQLASRFSFLPFRALARCASSSRENPCAHCPLCPKKHGKRLMNPSEPLSSSPELRFDADFVGSDDATSSLAKSHLHC